MTNSPTTLLESHAAFVVLMQRCWKTSKTRYDWARTCTLIDGVLVFVADDPCFEELETLEAIAYERGLMAMRP